MANIRIDVDYTIKNGSEVSFTAPCNCHEVTGLKVYHRDGSNTFTFKDTLGNTLTDIGPLFSKGAYVKVILDVSNGHAYIQNAATNKYLEDFFLKKQDAPVTPQMFGAVGDGKTDDTLAVLHAVQCGGIVYFPKGTYLITRTIGISQSVRLIGDGIGSGWVEDENGTVENLEGTNIKYTGEGFLFEIRTEYTNPAVIENMSFTGTATNSFIKCDSGSWGACVIVRDFYVYKFESEWLRLESAFKAMFENGTIKSKGKCVMTTYDGKQSTNNFNNCITFHNCYISNLWSQDANIPVMFELFHVRQLQFTECALERCDVMFKDFVTDVAISSEDYNPNTVCIADLNLDRCWLEFVGAIFDFQLNSEKPRITDCRFAKDVLNLSANVEAGKLDRTDGVRTGYYRNGETSSIESAIHGEQNIYANATIVNETDSQGEYFYPYIIASNRTMFNMPLNTVTAESADGKTVSYNVRNLARASRVSGRYRVLVFVHYGSGNRNVWEAELFSYSSSTAKTYMLIKKEKILSEGTGLAATATETLTSSNGELTFTTSGQALKLAMIVEYNFNGLTPM